METVLVTGASGTVGNYVVALAEAAGHVVIASDVNAAGLRAPARGEIRSGDLSDPAVRARVLRGVDSVVHTAALLDSGSDVSQLGKVNTELVVRLYEDAAKTGVRRFVHMSTSMLYGVGQSQPLTEDSEVAPRGPHGLSKQGAEAFLTGRAASDGPAWTVLRAAPIYGRRGRHFAAALLVVGPMLKLGLPVLPRFVGGPRASLVHAEDVARALLFCLGEPRTAQRVFNVSDDDPMTLGDRISMTFDAYGLRSVGQVNVPRSVLGGTAQFFSAPGPYDVADVAALSWWSGVVMRHGLKTALRPRLDREALSLLEHDLVVDSSRLRSLGWTPRHGRFREGLADVLRWYQAEGWVPRY